MSNSHRQLARSPDPDPFRLFHLGYVSTGRQVFSPDALIALLTEAREANAKRNVTGLLLYREGSFYQVLEGAESEVMSTFNDIKQDPRHDSVRVLFKGEASTREFADWQMGFLNLDGVDIESLTGYSNFLSNDAQPQEFLETLSRGKRLALMFRSML
ncbi:MAG: BLUF domain-containing protein [Halieaceae bacterium]|nr:BLUF domain-containing protein [Halieaceae bacterium]